MKKIKFVNIFWALFYILLFVSLLRGGFSYLDPDFGWHLKSGQEISQSGQVPRINHYNFTYTGNWVNHEWLSDWAAFQIYNNIGYAALVVLFAALIVLVMIILQIYWRRQLQDKSLFWVVAVLQLLGVQAALPHFGVRMQELALLFVLITLIIIAQYQKTRNFRWLLILPPGMFLWASLHASFLLGFFLMFSWLGIKIGERLIQDNFLNWKPTFWLREHLVTENILAWRHLVRFFYFIIFSLVATLLTPYRLELYSFLSGYQNRAYLSLIQEWLPQHIFPLHYDQLAYLALGLIALIFYFYERLKRRHSLDWWQIFLTSVFLFLSWQSRRHFPLFLVVSFGLMLEVYSNFFKEIKPGYKKWLQGLTLACLILAITAKAITVKQITDPFSSFCQKYPCQAVAFLQESPEYQELNLFNKYSWGGFLIWIWPEKKIFIDGRLPQVEFAGHTFVEEYFSFFQEDADFASKLEAYDIQLVLLDAESKPLQLKRWEKFFFNIKDEDLQSRNYLRDYLDNSTSWQTVYQDRTAKIYLLTK